jgi:hypothetical protein
MNPILFNPGAIVYTPGVGELIEKGVDLQVFLKRHLAGDWGDICEEDREENRLSLEKGFRLMSCYNTPHGALWIITEADRSSTCMLTPEEY